ncbi:hypothetical protein ACFQ1E_06955 [Sphingomonas canadensis]|uniref:Lipoprotein n=1 Tax=Sphingomonas canadensis TaxID=1219257 RepID=A0ABW3H3N3_9SPHN|nr:hypothetical protein [Sphingomonas canadensis]MCW3835473.1 hypothetical protein [Sphingomonas canadensis]
MPVSVLLAAALAAPACAFHDERGVLIASPNATPQFEAAGKPWFENGDRIAIEGGSFAKFGLPRQLAPAELEALADRNGVPVFVEAGDYSAEHDVIYVMVRSADCSFQPYARE